MPCQEMPSILDLLINIGGGYSSNCSHVLLVWFEFTQTIIPVVHSFYPLLAILHQVHL